MTSDDVSCYNAIKKRKLEDARNLIGSEIIDIRKNKSIIDLDFINNEKKYTLRYLTKKGEIKWIKPL